MKKDKKYEEEMCRFGVVGVTRHRPRRRLPPPSKQLYNGKHKAQTDPLISYNIGHKKIFDWSGGGKWGSSEWGSSLLITDKKKKKKEDNILVPRFS